MSPETPNRPRVGIPWRTSEEEAQNNRPKIANYEEAVRKAGGEPVLIPLNDGQEQRHLIPSWMRSSCPEVRRMSSLPNTGR